MKHSPCTAGVAIGVLLHIICGAVSADLAAGAADRPTEAGIELVPVVESGLQRPLFLTHAGDGSGYVFVVEQAENSLLSRQARIEKV